MNNIELKEELKAVLAKLLDGNKYVKDVRIDTRFRGVAYVRFDSLEKRHWPYGIDKNSIFIEFSVDCRDSKVNTFDVGHIYLSKADLRTERYRYLAMKSMTNVLVDYGGKKFRKSKFKSVSDLGKKMVDYYNTVMEAVERYTGGYPYKEGVE